MADTSVLEGLIQALRRLPGVGVKSASRMAYHLLQHDREGALLLSHALQQAAAQVQHCERCYTFTTQAVCDTCLDATRDASRLCVVETPADQSAKDIGLQKLMARADDGLVREVILATNFTAEGEATAHVVSEALKKRGVQVTRLARGVPVGSELEFVDLGTIAHALVDRRGA